MKKILSDLYSSGKFASIYTNKSDTSKFRYGRIIALDDTAVATQELQPNGEDDGISVFGIDEVLRVDVDGQYDDKMQRVCNREVTDIALPDSDSIAHSVLLFAMNAKSVVSIELLDSGRYDLCGFVEKFDDEECTIFLVDEYGYSDGYAHIDVANVTAISCDSGCEKIIAKLYANVSEEVKK